MFASFCSKRVVFLRSNGHWNKILCKIFPLLGGRRCEHWIQCEQNKKVCVLFVTILMFQDVKQIMPTCVILLLTLFIAVTVIPYAFSSVIKWWKCDSEEWAFLIIILKTNAGGGRDRGVERVPGDQLSPDRHLVMNAVIKINIDQYQLFFSLKNSFHCLIINFKSRLYLHHLGIHKLWHSLRKAATAQNENDNKNGHLMDW